VEGSCPVALKPEPARKQHRLGRRSAWLHRATLALLLWDQRDLGWRQFWPI